MTAPWAGSEDSVITVWMGKLKWLVLVSVRKNGERYTFNCKIIMHVHFDSLIQFIITIFLASKHVKNLEAWEQFIIHLGMNAMTEARWYTLMILASFVARGLMATKAGYWPTQSMPAWLYDSYQNEWSCGSRWEWYFSHPFIVIHHWGGKWDSYIH